MTETTVHVIDDDSAMRDSLRFLLESSGFTVITYESALHFLEAHPSAVSGCIVTDVRMPDMTGLQLVRLLNARGIRSPVIVITGHGDVPLAVEAMKEGVVDFLEKPFDEDRLLDAIGRAAATAEAAQARERERQRAKDAFDALSSREAEVLQGVVAGKLNKTIAAELGISPRTVEVYRANLMTKTGAGSVSELVRMHILVSQPI